MTQQGETFSSQLSENLYNRARDMDGDIYGFIHNISVEQDILVYINITYERYIYDELRIGLLIDDCLENYNEYSPKSFYAYLFNEILFRSKNIREENN